MEPLGTITVYFPFLDDETKDVLETIMNQSDTYFDFVNTLTKRVLDTTCSEFIVYFAIHHAAQLLDLNTIDLIGKKYPDVPSLQPNICYAKLFQGKTDKYESVLQAADVVLEMSPEDWLTLEMRFMKLEVETFKYPKVIQDSFNMTVIQEMIEANPRFKFYDTVLYNNLAWTANLDGNTEEWNRCNQIALENARKYDDQVRVAYILVEQARISSGNRVLARTLLRESMEIMDSLGMTEGYADILEQLGSIAMIRGEYTIAIDNYLKAVTIREGLDIETGNTSLMLSFLYNSVGEYESGLEWGQMAEDQFKGRPSRIPRAVMSQTWSLILLDRKSEAELLLDSIHEEVLKSGREGHLGWLNFVTGLIEFTKGNITAALSNLEESLKIFEAHVALEKYRNMSLYYLAKIEVIQADANTQVLPYLALLEERALQENLPGILGLAMLLKSDLALILNDDTTLQDMVKQLSTLSQEPGLSFLQPFIDRLWQRI